MPMRSPRRKENNPAPQHAAQVRVEFPRDQFTWLQQQAKLHDRTVQGMVRQLVREKFLANHPATTPQ